MQLTDRIKNYIRNVTTKDDPENVKDDVQLIQRGLETFPEYFNTVIRENFMPEIWRYRLEPEEYRERIQALDRDRRDKHIVMTMRINIMNRLADALGIEKPFETGLGRDLDPESVDDREVAATHAFVFCAESFLDQSLNIGQKAMDTVLYEMSRERLTFETKIDNIEQFAGMSENSMENTGYAMYGYLDPRDAVPTALEDAAYAAEMADAQIDDQERGSEEMEQEEIRD